MKNIKIAIDGPAAAGKSTVAQLVAKQLNFVYIDTGAMYRAVTVYCLWNDIDCRDEQKVASVLDNINITLYPDHSISLNDRDVTKEIRSTIVNENVSYIAANKEVRYFLVKQQRKIAENVSVVMDGRDIGTTILPDAEVKIFLTASPETRANRRYLELTEKGETCDMNEILKTIIERDVRDMNRAVSPLKQAEDAVLVDSSEMGIDEVVEKILSVYREKVTR